MTRFDSGSGCTRRRVVKALGLAGAGALTPWNFLTAQAPKRGKIPQLPQGPLRAGMISDTCGPRKLDSRLMQPPSPASTRGAIHRAQPCYEEHAPPEGDDDGRSSVARVAAPLESWIVPWICAVACPQAGLAQTTRTKVTTAKLFISCPPKLKCSSYAYTRPAHRSLI
jgi:hypothetical protein